MIIMRGIIVNEFWITMMIKVKKNFENVVSFNDSMMESISPFLSNRKVSVFCITKKMINMIPIKDMIFFQILIT